MKLVILLTLSALLADTTVGSGFYAKKGDFPFAVAIRMGANYAKYVCAGALISRKWVLTSAECIYGYDGSQSAYNVQAYGVNILASNEVDRRISSAYEIYPHPKYRGNFQDYNIGLIKVADEFVLFDIKPIQLPNLNTGMPGGIVGNMTSYGGTITSSVLQWTQVITMPIKECEAEMKLSLSDKEICTYYSSEALACYYDTGSPLITYDRDGTPILSGIAVFGGCLSKPEKPIVYASTSYPEYSQWITEISGIEPK